MKGQKEDEDQKTKEKEMKEKIDKVCEKIPNLTISNPYSTTTHLVRNEREFVTVLQEIFLHEPSASGYFQVSPSSLATWRRLGPLNIHKLVHEGMLKLEKSDTNSK